MGFIPRYVLLVEKLRFIIILLWGGLLAWGIIRGPDIFDTTDNAINPTPGTPSFLAKNIFQEYFPEQSGRIPWVILTSCSATETKPCPDEANTTILSDKTKGFLALLRDDMVTKYPGVFDDEVKGYYTFDGTPADEFKANFLSKDKLSTLEIWTTSVETHQSTRYEAYHYLLDLFNKHKKDFCPECFLGTVSYDSLGEDTTGKLAEEIARADIFTVPFAILILMYMSKGWRLPLITLFNIGTVILGSFAIMTEFFKATTPAQSITPQFMQVLAVAITIDYSLFFFTRFNEELEKQRKRWHARRKLMTTASFVPSSSPYQVNEAFSNASVSLSAITLASCEDPELDPNPFDERPMRSMVRAAIGSTVRHSGHVIFTSGFTLIISFLGFFLSGSTFLVQPAIGNAVSIFLTMVVSITVTPAFIFAFPSFFTDYNILPSFFYSLCCPRRRKHMVGDVDETGDEIEAENPDSAAEATYNAAMRVQKDGNDARVQSHKSFAANAFITSDSMYGYGTSDEQAVALTPEQLKMTKSCWYKMGRCLVSFPGNILGFFIIYSLMGYFVYKFSSMKLSHDLDLGLPTKAPSRKVIAEISEKFVPGVIQPFNVIFVSSSPDELGTAISHGSECSGTHDVSLFTPIDSQFHVAYGKTVNFDAILAENERVSKATLAAQKESLTDELFENAGKFITSLEANTNIKCNEHCTSPFMFRGKILTGQEARDLFDKDLVYRIYASRYISDPKDAIDMLHGTSVEDIEEFNKTNFGLKKTAFVISIMTDFSPQTSASESFVNTVRGIYDGTFDPTFVPLESVKYYMQGYKAEELDTIENTKEKLPMMVLVTTFGVLVLVAILLKSFFVPVRLMLTLIVPILGIFGLSVLVYQDGIFNFMKWDAVSNRYGAFYWDIPIFSFFVIFGLALDYDIFIIARITEYRENGYSNKAAIVLGLYETAPVITAAGLIMAITFSSLLVMDSFAAYQIGWLLVTSVLIDTFVVRSILVPAAMSFADRIGWYPRQVPRENLKDDLGGAQIEYASGAYSSMY